MLQILLRKNGEAELRARKMLNCEKKKNYKFDIVAVACSGEPSEKWVDAFFSYYNVEAGKNMYGSN